MYLNSSSTIKRKILIIALVTIFTGNMAISQTKDIKSQTKRIIKALALDKTGRFPWRRSWNGWYDSSGRNDVVKQKKGSRMAALSVYIGKILVVHCLKILN